MENNKVHDKRVVKLDHVLAKDFIPFKEGRPVRERVISNEDLLNLRIALNTADTLEEFMAHV